MEILLCNDTKSWHWRIKKQCRYELLAKSGAVTPFKEALGAPKKTVLWEKMKSIGIDLSSLLIRPWFQKIQESWVINFDNFGLELEKNCCHNWNQQSQIFENIKFPVKKKKILNLEPALTYFDIFRLLF